MCVHHPFYLSCLYRSSSRAYVADATSLWKFMKLQLVGQVLNPTCGSILISLCQGDGQMQTLKVLCRIKHGGHEKHPTLLTVRDCCGEVAVISYNWPVLFQWWGRTRSCWASGGGGSSRWVLLSGPSSQVLNREILMQHQLEEVRGQQDPKHPAPVSSEDVKLEMSE